MSGHRVAALYDALHAFESPFRKGAAYPVHKKLHFGDPSITDIYDWIIAEVGLPEHGAILDAGCGVGFGTIRIAESCTSQVTGISLSSREITAALQVAERSVATARLEFRQEDFDSLPPSSYDLVVAVESLKHSKELATTLSTICRAVRAGGKIVIVDDCYSGPNHNELASRLLKDWELTRLYQESDFQPSAERAQCHVVDLDDYIAKPGPVLRARRYFRSATLDLFGQTSEPSARRAFSGGTHLQQLYDAGFMHYKAIIATLSAESAEP